jgi:hypothetical protein
VTDGGSGFVCTAALIRIQNAMAMGHEDDGRRRGRYNNKTRTTFSCLTHENANQ